MNAMGAVRHFVNPEESVVGAVDHLRVCRLDVRIPRLLGFFFQLGPFGRGWSNYKTQAHKTNQKLADIPTIQIHSANPSSSRPAAATFSTSRLVPLQAP